MKELFQKLSNSACFFKENRLIYQEKARQKPKTDEEIFDEMVRKGEEAEKKRKEALAEYKAHPGEWKEEKEASKVNDAIEEAKELIDNVSWVGKINYKPPKFIDKRVFSFHHYITTFRPSPGSELSHEEKRELGDKIAKVGEFISDVQREMFNKELESEKWREMTPEAYQKNVISYFNKLNKSLIKMPGKERREFILYTAAFLGEGANEHAKNFVADMLTQKRPRNIITKYSKSVEVRVAEVPEEDEWE